MDKHSSKLEFKVGVFVALGLFAVMVSVLMLGADKVVFTRYLRIKAHFTEVQGLFPGSVVSLAGIPVGNVEKLDFTGSENKLEATLKIDQKFAHRVVEGTIAEIRTQGALGDKFVYLTPGSPGGKQIENGTVISATETDYLKMLTSREDGVARVIDLIKEMQALVQSINQNGQAGVMMKNLADASFKFKSTLAQIDGVLGDLRGENLQNSKLKQSMASLASILAKVDSGKGTLGQLINDPSLHQSLKSFLGGSPRNRYMKDMIRESLQTGDKSGK
jgi:phospholipid/cholesterol/gamma-HCH transport system substrate-binding protein